VIAEQGVIENVAPIQLGIRLLIPEGSRMLELEDVRRMIAPFDPQSLAYLGRAPIASGHTKRNRSRDCRAAERQKESRPATFERIWKAAHSAAGCRAAA